MIANHLTPLNTTGNLPTLSHTDQERIAAALEEARSEATRRVYGSQWGQWTAWAADRGVDPMPANPVLLAAYLSD